MPFFFAFARIHCNLIQGKMARRTTAKLDRAKPGRLRRNFALIPRPAAAGLLGASFGFEVCV
ncbi:MAG: hypothetical protein BBJ60_04430 [Desulfobacterales bacterium S7086C20]|nr:MAG: hypothetical protein BBJ60_04430 [Desulfobacterales bacterium S7086C20]